MNPYDFMMEKKSTIVVYTDGSCLGNPGPGGWAWVDVQSKQSGKGHLDQTTNNVMELTACVEALNSLNSRNVLIRTDSNYVKRGITEWIKGWKARGWLTAARKPVKNKDLWMRLDALQALYEPKWEWVKAHAKDEWNNQVDKMAREEAQSLQ